MYTYRYTVTSRMIPGLRWAAMRRIFNVSSIVRDKATRQCQQTTTFEEKGEPNRGPSAYQPNALSLDQTGLRLMVGSLDPQSPVARRFL